MTDVKRYIPTISGTITFINEWGIKSDFDIKWIRLYKRKRGIIDPKKYILETGLKPAVFVNRLTDYNNMLDLLKDSTEHQDLYEFLGGGL